MSNCGFFFGKFWLRQDEWKGCWSVGLMILSAQIFSLSLFLCLLFSFPLWSWNAACKAYLDMSWSLTLRVGTSAVRKGAGYDPTVVLLSSSCILVHSHMSQLIITSLITSLMAVICEACWAPECWVPEEQWGAKGVLTGSMSFLHRSRIVMTPFPGLCVRMKLCNVKLQSTRKRSDDMHNTSLVSCISYFYSFSSQGAKQGRLHSQTKVCCVEHS